jgi:hypothetical protein
VSDRVRDIFINISSMDEYASPRKSMCTRDNDTFVRHWHEISLSRIGFNCNTREESKESGLKWFPYQKGGTFRKWYGNHSSVVDWENDGYKLLNMLEFGYQGNSTNHNLDYIFKPAIIWSKITSSIPDFRYSPLGFLFDDASGLCYINNLVNINPVLGFTNSKLGPYLLKMINPTLNIQPRNVSSLPVLIDEFILRTNVVQSLIAKSRQDWDNFETSWDFKELPLLRVGSRKLEVGSYDKKAGSEKLKEKNSEPEAISKLSTLNSQLTTKICDAFSAYCDNYRSMTLEMQRLEEENNRIFIDAYGLQDELTPDVPLHEITLTGNPFYRYGVKEEVESGQSAVSRDEEVSSVELEVGSGKWEEKNSKPEAIFRLLTLNSQLSTHFYDRLPSDVVARYKADTIKEYISYAVGCMMGRYSLDAPGLILAGGGKTVEDYCRIVESRKLEVGSRELEVNNKLSTLNSQLQTVNEVGSRKLGEGESSDDCEKFQRSDCMAAIHEIGKGNLFDNTEIPKGGTLRSDVADTSSSCVDTQQYSRGSGQENCTGFQELSQNNSRFESRTGNADSNSDSIGVSEANRSGANSGFITGIEKNASRTLEQSLKTLNSTLSTPIYAPDDNAIIPVLDDDYFDDDIVSRFIDFVRITFGESDLSENLAFIADALGRTGNESSHERIRKYFLRDFYKDHCQRYKKRPIYWMFTSGKKNGFNCLIYLHRYHPGMVAQIRTDYLHELQEKLEVALKNLHHVMEHGSKGEQAKARKRLAVIEKQQSELIKYDELLRHYADMAIDLDLDDGVKVNYEKFGELLEKVG